MLVRCSVVGYSSDNAKFISHIFLGDGLDPEAMQNDTPTALSALSVDVMKLKRYLDELVRSSIRETLNAGSNTKCG